MTPRRHCRISVFHARILRPFSINYQYAGPRAVVGLLAIAVVLVGCGGGSTKFDTPTYPFTFEYPQSWKLNRSKAFVYGSNAGVRSVSATYKAPYNQVTVTQYKLPKVLKPGQNVNKREIDRVARLLARQSRGHAGPGRPVVYGRIPGYQYAIDYKSGGVAIHNVVTFLFRHDDEFQVLCQSSGSNREKVQDACDQVLNSFALRG